MAAPVFHEPFIGDDAPAAEESRSDTNVLLDSFIEPWRCGAKPWAQVAWHGGLLSRDGLIDCLLAQAVVEDGVAEELGKRGSRSREYCIPSLDDLEVAKALSEFRFGDGSCTASLRHRGMGAPWKEPPSKEEPDRYVRRVPFYAGDVSQPPEVSPDLAIKRVTSAKNPWNVAAVVWR